MFYLLAEILFCIVDIVFLHIFLKIFLPEKTFKYNLNKYIIIIFLGIVLHKITEFKLYSNYSNVLSLIIIIIYGVIMFEGKMQNRILFSIIFHILEGTCITIILNIAAFLSVKSISKLLAFFTMQRIITVIFVKIIIFLIIEVIKYFTLSLKMEIPKKYKYMLLSIFIMTFIGIGIIFETSVLSSNPSVYKFMVLLTTSFIVFNVIILVLLQKISSFMQEQSTTSIIVNAQINLEKHILELDKTQQEIKKMKHDMLNHYGVLEYLIENEKKEESLDYVKSLRVVVESAPTYYKTGNDIADAVINQKIDMNRQYNIDFNIQIYIPQAIQIKPMDMGAILSNLLDNAIEAVKEVEANNRVININIHPHNEKLLIDIANTVICNPIKEGKLIRRQKQHYSEHGYGMKSIQYVVDQYDGYMDYKYEKGLFNIIVLLNCK